MHYYRGGLTVAQPRCNQYHVIAAGDRNLKDKAVRLISAVVLFQRIHLEAGRRMEDIRLSPVLSMNFQNKILSLLSCPAPRECALASCDDCLGWVVFRKATPWLSTLVLSWVTPEPHSHMDLHNLRVSWGLCHRKWYELIYDCIPLAYIYLPSNVIVIVNY